MVETQGDSLNEKIRPVTPGRWEKYHPKAVLGLLLKGVDIFLDRIVPPLFLATVGSSISYALTVNTELPTVVRFGLGAAAGLGLTYILSRSKSEEYSHPPKFQP